MRDTQIARQKDPAGERVWLNEWITWSNSVGWSVSTSVLLLSSSSTSAYSLRLLQCISSFHLIYMNCKRRLRRWGEAQREIDTDRDRQTDRETLNNYYRQCNKQKTGAEILSFLRIFFIVTDVSSIHGTTRLIFFLFFFFFSM